MLGPDFEYLYLTDQLDETHPEYERQKNLFAGTPQGKRIEEFRKQNREMLDGLNCRPLANLDNIIREEGVVFTGNGEDRIGKIMAIRRHRSAVEKEKLRGMTKEQKEAYLAQQKVMLEGKRRSTETNAQEDRRTQTKAADGAQRLADLAEAQKKRLLERQKQREEGRKFLDEEAARRSNVNPAEARQEAMEKAQKKEEETVPEEGLETGVEGVDTTVGSDTANGGIKNPSEEGNDTVKAPNALQAGDGVPDAGEKSAAAPEPSDGVGDNRPNLKSQQRRGALMKGSKRK